MGRESECFYSCRGQTHAAKALLESTELILRGATGSDLRRRIPFAEMTHVAAHDAVLSFAAGKDSIELHFPREIAAAWAEKIQTPPPSLAAKLGITRATRLYRWGEAHSEELTEAGAEAQPGSLKACDLGVAEVSWDEDVVRFLAIVSSSLATGVPFWIVYRKGKGDGVKETTVRELARDAGFIDTKVAGVSATHTALRFIRRKTGL